MPAILAACGGLSACVSQQPGTVGPSLAMAPMPQPVLPEAVSAVPSANPDYGSDQDAMRSLAHEVEVTGNAQPAAFAGPEPSAKLAALDAQPAPANAAPEDVAARPAGEPIEPTDEKSVVQAVVDVPVQAARVTMASLGDVASDLLPARFGGGNDNPSHSRAAPDGRMSPPGGVDARSPELDELMGFYANYYGVPEKLVRRVAKRESTFNPRARNGRYLGLMQISMPTARGMGYRGGAEGLLDAETNLKYAVRYLRGAYVVANGDHDKADRLYQSGYYYHAKRAGLLDETGVGVDRKRRRRL